MKSLPAWGQAGTGAANLLLPAGVATAVSNIGKWSTSRSVWTFVVALLVTALVLALSALWKELPRQRLDLGLPERRGVTVPVADTAGNIVGMGLYFHVEVGTKWKHEIRRCKGDLIRVETRDAYGNYQTDPHFLSPLPLKWANQKPEMRELDIDPDLPRLLDFVAREQAKPEWAIIMTTDHDRIGMPTVLVPGDYRLTVRVRAEGCAPADCVLDVSVGESWDALSVTEVNRKRVGRATARPARA